MEVYNLKRKRVKRNFIIISIVYLILGFLLVETVVKTSIELYTKSKEKREFKEELSILKEKEEELKGQVNKLEDPDYIARYAREKYLYSKDGEIIIRIPD